MTTLRHLLFSASLVTLAVVADRPVRVVGAPDAPVRLESAKLLNTDAAPLVLLYAAKNTGSGPIDQFTVTAYVFEADGRLKARQVAPGRRELNAGETKYSAMVLDVGDIAATDAVMAGVDQVQAAGSETWWRTDLRAIAEAAAKSATPPRH